MSGQEGAESVVFNPAHWDGHMLGDGQAVAENIGILDSSVLPRRSVAKLARQMLRDGVVEALGNEPLRTFGPGSEFDISVASEGTFVLFDQEKVDSSPSTKRFRIDDTGEDLDIHSLDWRHSFFSRWYNDMQYIRSTRLGVVVSDSRYEYVKRLVAGPSSNIIEYSDGSLGYIPLILLAFKSVLPVGEVRHWVRSSGKETIERVNKVELYRGERPQRERKPVSIRELLGRRATGWAQA